jgi:sugar/nucleoside kinase (ribokinase family)
MKIWDVSIVGEIYIDHVMNGFASWPAPGEEVVTENYVREIGGGSAITACALARLGKSVNLIGFIGDDDAPWVDRRLRNFGVSSQGLHRIAGPTGVTLSVSTSEDRSFFTHVGVNRHLNEELLTPEILPMLSRARHVHFAMPLPRKSAATLLPALAQAGCTTSLDVGYQPGWLKNEANRVTCQAIDYFLPNEKEAALLSGGATPADFVAFARRIRMASCVVKLGARGAIADGDGVTVSVNPPQVTPVDTTGSGDAFDAGFIDALLEGADWQERLRRGCICGALSTRVAGALGGLPTRGEIWSVYEQTYGS